MRLCGFRQISFVIASANDPDTPGSCDNSLKRFRGGVSNLPQVSFDVSSERTYCVRASSSLSRNLFEVCSPVDVVLVSKELKHRETHFYIFCDIISYAFFLIYVCFVFNNSYKRSNARVTQH